MFLLSDDDVEETHPMDGNDSDYDPKKEAKKEVIVVIRVVVIVLQIHSERTSHASYWEKHSYIMA